MKYKMFSDEEIEGIRAKVAAHPEYIAALDRTTADLRRKLYIQKTGRATWSHYFICPHCSVRLIYDYDDPINYECPSCHKIFNGEPYEGSWWDTTMVKNTLGAHMLAVCYVATEDEKYLATAKDILLGYAENYKNYEVHGNIPYNHPGRFASQVLSDSGPLAELACAYALLREKFTEEEQRRIENDLFREASKHQIKYSTDQIHNHEVVICSSLAIMGLVIGDEDILDFAIERKYGLKYQLDHAVLEDGLWFECATGYHAYALRWMMRFEHAARNTERSLFADPHYRAILEKMIRFPLRLATPAGYPFFNDAAMEFHPDIYEYAYAVLGGEDILTMLCEYYKNEPRENIYALLYGVDTLPTAKPYEYKNYFSKGGSGLAVVNGKQSSLWFKATPYGGEHDHYDRLSLSLTAFGRKISADLGTAAGYGAPLHYSYFKNTASHNTVVIDGENMAPCDTHVIKYEERPDGSVYLEAQTDTPEEYRMLDSFTIKQWSDEAYAGVRMRRAVSWRDGYLIDFFKVSGENDLRKEWVWHTDGVHALPENAKFLGSISETGAQKHLRDAYTAEYSGVARISVDCDDIKLDIHADTEGKELILAYGPSNPSTSDLSYVLERSYERCPVYANVIDVYRDEPNVRSVEYIHGETTLTVRVTETSGRVNEVKFDL